MKKYRICNGEFKVMMILWDLGETTAGAIVEVCEDKYGWKRSTTYTEIVRLAKKGYVEKAKSLVRALVSRDEVQIAEAQEFVDRVFVGSLPTFLTAYFNGREKLTKAEAGELKKIIDKYIE